MKKLLLLSLGLVLSNFLFAQTTADLTIAGINADVEKKILPGDRISYFEFDDGTPQKNIKVVARSYAGKKNFFGSADVKSVNGHYELNHVVTIKESSKLPFDGEIELLISIPTIYGNAIWTKVVRNKSNFTDPIFLDRYTEKADSDYDARGKFELNFTCIAYDNEFKQSVKDKGDGWSKRKKEHFKFMLKNKGDSEWKINEVMEIGSITNGSSASAKIANQRRLDLEKIIVMRVEVTTEQGNILWNEVEFEARGMNRTYFGVNYDIAGESASPENDETTTTVDDISTQEDNSSNTGENATNEESGNTNESSDNSNISSESNSTTTTTSTNIDNNSSSMYKGATDLTTKTIKALCQTPSKGDTVMNINGSLVCVKGYSFRKSREVSGMLALDCNLEQKGVLYPAKGGHNISINVSNGSIVELTLRADMIVSNEAGDFILKNGSKVILSNGNLVRGSLAENATLKSGNLTLICTPNAVRKYDIQFGKNGVLKECTLAEPLSVEGPINFNFPAGSRLELLGGNFKKVFCSQSTDVTISDVKYNVKGDPKSDAYEFNENNVLSEIISGDGNSVNIDGKDIPASAGKVIKFEVIDGVYYVSKFFAAEQVTIMVHGKKNKEVTVKAGKKIILEKGVVVKAG